MIEWDWDEKYMKEITIDTYLLEFNASLRVADMPKVSITTTIYGLFKNLSEEDKQLLLELLNKYD